MKWLFMIFAIVWTALFLINRDMDYYIAGVLCLVAGQQYHKEQE